MSLAHFSHESSAWNLALAVGFLCAAARPARGRGMLPLIGAFVALLTTLSVLDLALHRVAGARLLPHTLAVVGWCALLALTRRLAPLPGDTPTTVPTLPTHSPTNPVPNALLRATPRAQIHAVPNRSGVVRHSDPTARRAA